MRYLNYLYRTYILAVGKVAKKSLQSAQKFLKYRGFGVRDDEIGPLKGKFFHEGILDVYKDAPKTKLINVNKKPSPEFIKYWQDRGFVIVLNEIGHIDEDAIKEVMENDWFLPDEEE